MNDTEMKEHLRRDIQFHLRCAGESVRRLIWGLDMKNVEEVVKIAIEEERLLLINTAAEHGT